MTVGEVVDMRVADVRRGVAEDDKPRSFLIILEEIDGERRLSIWTGEELGMDLVLSLEKGAVSAAHAPLPVQGPLRGGRASP